MTSPTRRRGRAALWVLAAFLGGTPAVAQPAAAGGEAQPVLQPYDIPALPLDQALTRFGTLGRVDVLYEPDVATGKRSTAVAGTLTRQAALEALLKETGLSFRFTSAHSALVFRPDQAPAEAGAAVGPAGSAAGDDAPRLVLDEMRITAPQLIGSPPRTRFEPYGRSVQADIDHRLRTDAVIHGRAFQVRLAIRIDAEGVLRSLNIVRSTGDSALDSRIQRVLEEARLPEPPPIDLPQPIWFDVAQR